MPSTKLASLSRLVTEQTNPQSAHIDELNTEQMLRVINAEDAKVAAAVEQQIPNIARAVEAIVEKLRAGGRLLYIGAGTSGRLGVLDASECPPTYNTSPEIVQGVMAGGMKALYKAGEANEDSPEQGRHDLEEKRISARDAVVGLTASGRTPYVIHALRYAKSRGAAAIAITCNPDSEVGAVAQITIAPVVGPEVITGSTRMKAGTAQKLVLNMISTASMVRLGHVYGNFMVNMHLKNEKLVERARITLQRLLGIDRSQASRLLTRARSDLKVAIVMQKLAITRAAAVKRLAENNNQLRKTLAETERK